VADGKVKAITLFPLGVFGLVVQGVEVRHGEQVCRAQRLADIALALDLAHAQGMAANVMGALHQRGGGRAR
jgi:hypothetical protein